MFDEVHSKCILYWERLNVGTVPMVKMHPVGTVPTVKMHPVETVPPGCILSVGTVPMGCILTIGTVPTLTSPQPLTVTYISVRFAVYWFDLTNGFDY